jgi:DNA-binding GntR family transcriptional regulator
MSLREGLTIMAEKTKPAPPAADEPVFELDPTGGAPSRGTQEIAYALLRQTIIDGHLPPGQQLREVSLAKSINVSRTPVREALSRLEQDGLVVRNERGVVVRERSPDEILDLYQVRILLEQSAASDAAMRRTTADLLALRRGVAARLDDASDAEDVVRRNRDFHQAVWRASHNSAAIDLLQRLDLHLARYPATTLVYPGRKESAQQEHEELFAAIEASDPAAAAAVALRHFTEARNIRIQLWEQSS